MNDELKDLTIVYALVIMPVAIVAMVAIACMLLGGR